MADALKAHVAAKAPKAKVFAMPLDSDESVAMMRADLAAARKAWLAAARHDPGEFARRQQSDFLSDVNHEGEVFDFHSLRHTCGAWLALAGSHPNVVQQPAREPMNLVVMLPLEN